MYVFYASCLRVKNKCVLYFDTFLKYVLRVHPRQCVRIMYTTITLSSLSSTRPFLCFTPSETSVLIYIQLSILLHCGTIYIVLFTTSFASNLNGLPANCGLLCQSVQQLYAIIGVILSQISLLRGRRTYRLVVAIVRWLNIYVAISWLMVLRKGIERTDVMTLRLNSRKQKTMVPIKAT